MTEWNWKTVCPLLLVFSGSANILLIKWADHMKSAGSDGVTRSFEHPFLQTSVMFFGEFLCFLVFKVMFTYFKFKNEGREDTNILTAGGREFSTTVFLIPTVCDVISSAMLFIGLYLTYASSCQMLRAVLIIFTGIFGVHYLNQSIKTYQWIGMLVISLGAIIIIASDVQKIHVNNGNLVDANAVLTGDLLIICSQIFQSVQLVYEEKYIKIHDIPPLQAVGWQGMYGFIMSALLIIPLNFLKVEPPFDNNAREVAEDLPDALVQLSNNVLLIVAHCLFIVSVAIYNFAKISILKESSACNMALLDNMRIIMIWLFALGFEWQTFHVLETFGFAVFLSGAFIYRNVVFTQIYRFILGRIARRRYGELDPEVTIQQADAT